MKIRFAVIFLFTLLGAAIAFAAVNLVKLRDSTDEQPAFGTVDFSYLRKDPLRKTDRDGNINLPPPSHDKADPIEVCPDDKTKYGSCFRQQFPKDDGFTWLLTRSGAAKLERRAEELGQQEKFKPAAALTAIAGDFYKELDQTKSQALLIKALGFLARNYDMKPSAGVSVTPEDQLRQAVLRDSGVTEKPAALGAWDSLDFLCIAGETRSEALKSAGLATSR